MNRSRIAFVAFGFLAASLPVFSRDVVLVSKPESGLTAFATREIDAALRTRQDTPSKVSLSNWSLTSSDNQIVLAETTDETVIRQFVEAGGSGVSELLEEGFCVFRTNQEKGQTIWVIGKGPGGVLYGGLEVAEQIRLYGFDQVTSGIQNPYMAMRGTKFNIPLDVRTPSYTDMGDSAQANIAEMWNFDFWTEYLDSLARFRYNYVSLWNLHPFPSMVKVPDYPDVALDDVWRSTVDWEEDYPGNGTGFDSPEILENVEVLKKITIDEKIDFWRRVMAYAKDRNIDFYIVTWNIFDYGAHGKYGITDDIDNPVTIDYFRKSVAQLLLTYPLLRGVGLTTGENMGDASFEEKEDWAFATYGQGLLDAARASPGRQIRFIHRQHQTRAQDIARTFAPLVQHPDIDFIFSFKYAQAHVMSSTTQTFDRRFVEALGDLKTIWTMRNDDDYLFRWGAPDFVREFIENVPYDVSQGFYYGSDQWVWGREFLSLNPQTPRELEIKKHWYHWMMWGRLGYDPTLDNERFLALLAERFPEVSASILFEAWQNASMTYPLTTGFHWGEYDYQWYIEACRSRPGPAQTESGFHDVNRFITLDPHPDTDNMSIPDYVEAVVSGENSLATTPVQVADALDEHATAAIDALKGFETSENQELRATLADISAMALMGKYYSRKILGATNLALYRRTKNVEYQQQAIEDLTQAAEYWTQYTSLASSLYKSPIWMNRVGIVDWEELNAEVLHDIEIARAGAL